MWSRIYCSLYDNFKEFLTTYLSTLIDGRIYKPCVLLREEVLTNLFLVSLCGLGTCTVCAWHIKQLLYNSILHYTIPKINITHSLARTAANPHCDTNTGRGVTSAVALEKRKRSGNVDSDALFHWLSIAQFSCGQHGGLWSYAFHYGGGVTL